MSRVNDRQLSDEFINYQQTKFTANLSDNANSHRLQRQKQEKTKSQKDDEVCSEAHINGMIFLSVFYAKEVKGRKNWYFCEKYKNGQCKFTR